MITSGSCGFYCIIHGLARLSAFLPWLPGLPLSGTANGLEAWISSAAGSFLSEGSYTGNAARGIEFSFPETAPRPRTGETAQRCGELETRGLRMFALGRMLRRVTSGACCDFLPRMDRSGVGYCPDIFKEQTQDRCINRWGPHHLKAYTVTLPPVFWTVFFPRTQKGVDLLFKLKKSLKAINMNSFLYFFFN